MTSRLTIVTTGAFCHPYDQVPIDARWSEPVDTERLPEKRILNVDSQHRLDFGELTPRAVLVRNLAGSDRKTYPDEDERRELERNVLCVGLGAVSRANACELPPAVPGERTFGGHVMLPVGPEAIVWLWPKDPGCSVRTLVLAFPG